MTTPIYPITLCMLISHVGSWTIKTHTPHGNVPNAQKHVHVTKRGLHGVYSWNIDGSRHDDHKFPFSEQCIKAAKKHAADTLGVSAGTLSLVMAIPGGRRVSLRSGEPWQRNGVAVFNSYLKKQVSFFVFEQERGLVLVLSDDAESRHRTGG